MNCTEALRRVSSLHQNELPDKVLEGHLACCSACREIYTTQCLTQVLQEYRLPDPEESYFQAVMSQAAIRSDSGKKKSSQKWALALAASLVIGSAVLIHQFGEQQGFMQPMSAEQFVPPDSAEIGYQQVRILIVSDADYDSVRISILLEDDVELVGYAGYRELVWDAGLVRGENLLALPVRVYQRGGQISIQSSFGGSEHQVHLQLAGDRADESADNS